MMYSPQYLKTMLIKRRCKVQDTLFFPVWNPVKGRQDCLPPYPFYLSTFFWDNGAGYIIYDTRVKCPVSSYLLKWGAGLLPLPWKLQFSGARNCCLGLKKNYIHGIEVPAQVTEKSFYQVKRIISQLLSVRQISCLVQSLAGATLSAAWWTTKGGSSGPRKPAESLPLPQMWHQFAPPVFLCWAGLH